MFNNINKNHLAIFIFINLITILFCFYTDHRWEDWYITYKASKNLGSGAGLVFHAGERLHTFTSPIGTLIPAFLTFISGASDEFVIWSYRILCSLTLSVAGIYLYKLLSEFSKNQVIAWGGVVLFATHILIVDFSINGMETAYMMLFLILFIYTLYTDTRKKLLKLSLIIAALMYTRPDSIVYYGSFIVSLFIFFPRFTKEIKSRKDFIIFFAKVAGISFLFYCPWLIGTTLYYGTPIPHTITAKGNIQSYKISDLAKYFFTLPYDLIVRNDTPANSLFVPPYVTVHMWAFGSIFSKILVCFTAAYVLFFRGNNFVRAVSFTVLLVVYYLYRVSGQGGMPWYLPNATIYVIIGFMLILSVLKIDRKVLLGILAVVGGINAVIFGVGAHAMKTHQEVVEFGNRKEIGLWLKENSKEKDTVFMECLGYIGYFSELKTLDFPGMSSLEVVNSRKKMNSNKFSDVIMDLKPSWLALRPWEAENASKDYPEMFRDHYTRVKTFDVTGNIPDIIGKEYLMYDSHFDIYKLNDTTQVKH